MFALTPSLGNTCSFMDSTPLEGATDSGTAFFIKLCIQCTDCAPEYLASDVLDVEFDAALSSVSPLNCYFMGDGISGSSL